MFRMSESQHEELKRICRVTHKQSVSEVVRLAVEYWIESGGTVRKDELHSRVQNLEQRVEAMAMAGLNVAKDFKEEQLGLDQSQSG
jgi:hypothetical protein